MAIDIGLDKIKSFDLWRAVLAEFTGSALFLLAATCVSLTWGSTDMAANNVEVGIGIGLSFASLCFVIGHVSGGHLNPAVSLAMVLAQKISVIQGLLYIVAQLVGGIVGSALTYACTPKLSRESLGATFLSNGITVGQGFGLELLFTFVLVLFIFAITDEKKKVDPYGATLGIGVIALVCHVCLIPFTGCGINPARSFGPALVMDIWTDHWLYWIGPLLGGIAAAVIYKFVLFVKDE